MLSAGPFVMLRHHAAEAARGMGRRVSRPRRAPPLPYNRVGPRFERSFSADTQACIKGRGTLRAAKSLESKIRSITQNGSRPAYYLKCDLANFFVSIDKRVRLDLLLARIPEPFWRALTETVLMHDPRADFAHRGDPARMNLAPLHKRLLGQPAHLGLPIGNLSSQFFANVYLDVPDPHAKHQLRARHYVRYVDDFVFLHESADWLNAVLADVTAFLPERLGVQINPRKTILQPIDRGVDFVGQVIKPWRRDTQAHAQRGVEPDCRNAGRRPDAGRQFLFRPATTGDRQPSRSRHAREWSALAWPCCRCGVHEDLLRLPIGG